MLATLIECPKSSGTLSLPFTPRRPGQAPVRGQSTVYFLASLLFSHNYFLRSFNNGMRATKLLSSHLRTGNLMNSLVATERLLRFPRPG